MFNNMNFRMNLNRGGNDPFGDTNNQTSQQNQGVQQNQSNQLMQNIQNMQNNNNNNNNNNNGFSSEAITNSMIVAMLQHATGNSLNNSNSNSNCLYQPYGNGPFNMNSNNNHVGMMGSNLNTFSNNSANNAFALAAALGYPPNFFDSQIQAALLNSGLNMNSNNNNNNGNNGNSINPGPNYFDLNQLETFGSYVPQSNTFSTSSSTSSSNPTEGLYGATITTNTNLPTLSNSISSGSTSLSTNSHASQLHDMNLNLFSNEITTSIPQTSANLPSMCPRTTVPGLYSCTGFDMIGVLARVATRKNPQVSIGPVDMSCSFVVSDARANDMPIVYISGTFEKLSGYTARDCVGKNCRFLQSPDGQVHPGSHRRYVDNATVYSLKQAVHAKRECQYTLINYRKGGEPFINLITIIPIQWDESVGDGSPDYFVGFQVDLVEQPNAIMNRMKNGTYVVNYRLADAPVSVSRVIPDGADAVAAAEAASVRRPQINAIPPESPASQPVRAYSASISIDGDDPSGAGESGFASAEEKNSRRQGPPFSAPLDLGRSPAKVSANVPPPAAVPPVTGSFAIDVTSLVGVSDAADAANVFYRSLVEQSDFVHVLSLRGILLYVSPDCRRVLEYDESELVGHSLGEFCHPGDLVSVMREIKESSNGTHMVHLVYRIRRKHSGYMWMEVAGKCTQGEKAKGKKFVVLTGRAKPVVRVHRSDVAAIGGMQPHDIWCKLALEGLVLHVAAPAVASENSALSISSSITPISGTTASALASAAAGLNSDVGGALAPVIHSAGAVAQSPSVRLLGFSPAELVGRSLLDLVPSSDVPAVRSALDGVRNGHVNVLAHMLKNKKGDYLQVTSAMLPGDDHLHPHFALIRISHRTSTSQVNPGDVPRSFPATAVIEEMDDVFDVLSPARCTSWQYEMHQLRLQNRRLRAELDLLEINARSKKRTKHTRSSGSSNVSRSSTSAKIG
jgi:PAS domain S-box-containing protein